MTREALEKQAKVNIRNTSIGLTGCNMYVFNIFILARLSLHFLYIHGGMIEKEMRLFFLSEISVYLS